MYADVNDGLYMGKDMEIKINNYAKSVFTVKKTIIQGDFVDY